MTEKRCKRCGACQECGAVPFAPYYPYYPAVPVYPGTYRPWPQWWGTTSPNQASGSTIVQNTSGGVYQ